MSDLNDMINSLENGDIPFDRSTVCKILKEIRQELKELKHEVTYNRELRHHIYGGCFNL